MSVSNNLPFLKSLEDLNKNLSIEVTPLFDDSLNLHFQPISTLQQRQLLNQVLNEEKTELGFRKLITDIVLNNLIEKEHANILTVFDREFILLKLRSHFIEDKIEKDSESFSLLDHLNQFEEQFRSTYRQQFLQDLKHQRWENIEISCGVPTLKREQEILNYQISQLKPEADSLDQIKEVLGSVFYEELLRYIQDIKIYQDSKEEIIFNFGNQPVNKFLLETLGKIPLSAIQLIITNIYPAYRKIYDLLLKGGDIKLDYDLFSVSLKEKHK